MLLRKSGTEPMVRVMVEAADEGTCEAYIEEMVAVIQGEGLTV
jgi:phosphoglucosamine mutase